MARAAALHAGEGFKLKPFLAVWVVVFFFFFYVHPYFPSSLSGAAAHLLAVIIDGEAARRGQAGGTPWGTQEGQDGAYKPTPQGPPWLCPKPELFRSLTLRASPTPGI